MRKLDATVNTGAFGDGARMVIKTRNGELLAVDLSESAMREQHAVLDALVQRAAPEPVAVSAEPSPLAPLAPLAPAGPAVSPKPSQQAPTKPRAKK